GSSGAIEFKAGGAEVIDARGKVVLPGFVDAHTHLVFAGNRLDDFERRARGDTYEQIAKAGGGIWSTVEKTRAASESDLVDQSRRILGAAKELGLKLRIHADQLSNSGASTLAAELKTTTADHLEQTDERGIALLKSAEVQPVLLPGSVYALGSTRYPRARQMV